MKNEKLKAFPILVVDDEELWLHGISLTMEHYGGFANIVKCQDSRLVMDILAEKQIGLILLDLVMPNLSGEKLLHMIVESYPEIPVIVITGMNQTEIGLRCIKIGAFDFFVKTVGKDELIISVHRAIRLLEMKNLNDKLEKHFLSERLSKPEAFSDIITQDHRMKSIFRYIEAVSQSPKPLLISGESGTGKEMIACAAHRVSCPDEPFVSVNISGLDDNIFSDTLFGHVKGAYTGAENNRLGLIKKAGSGVVFLDEIGDLSMLSQTKLLRILQEGEYMPLGSDEFLKTNARFFFATNKNLNQLIEEGKFRKDLYYRIGTHHVQIPPLRERHHDLLLLINYFIDSASASMEIVPPTWQSEMLICLKDYNFPGNVRELSSIIYDVVSQTAGKSISIETLKQFLRPIINQLELDKFGYNQDNSIVFSQYLPTLNQINRILIEEAMRRSNGNQTNAAGILGISQPSLSRRLKTIKEKFCL